MLGPMRFHALVFFLSLAVLGCDSASSSTDAGLDAGSSPTDGSMPVEDAGAGPPSSLGTAERPAELVLPADYDGVTAFPAVVLLHGYGANGGAQDLYLGLSRAARIEGFYVVIPNGTVDAGGRRFWNATPACCDFAATGVDDVGYLTGLLDELEATVPVADGQVFFVGHSNGGFMSYRMGCERADRVAAFASLAGSDFATDTDCVPSQPVSVLQIHGDLDGTIFYGGGAPGETFGVYPSAPEAVARWATRASCDGTTVDGDALDLEGTLAGAETETVRYESGCTAGAELWTIRGGGHIPNLNREFAPAVLAWLRAHGR
jgi:polyhydroxybutyrate depolymerase